MLKRTILAVFAGVMASSWAVAGPPVKNRIPDTAKWAVHLDVEAITKSAIAGGILEMISAEDSPVPKDKAAKALKVWGILGKLKSVTLYGSTCAKTGAVVVVDHRYDEVEAMKLLHISDDCPTLSHGSHRIYTYPPKHSRKRGMKFVCFHSDGILVGAMTQTRLKEALDLLDGKGKPLAKDNPLAKILKPSKGSFMVAAIVGIKKMKALLEVEKPGWGKKKPRAALLLEKAEVARFELGEVGKNVFTAFNITMATEEDADDMLIIAQGLRAGLLLHGRMEEQKVAREATTRKDATVDSKTDVTTGKNGATVKINSEVDGIDYQLVRKVVRAIKINQEDKSVTVSIEYPAKDILALLMQTVVKHVTAKAEKKIENEIEVP